MTTTTIDERLDLIEEMGRENKVLLDSIKAKAETPPPLPSPVIPWLWFGMGGIAGAGAVAIAWGLA
ncbi:MAG: hypothetical protein HC771_21250 [Synechococcales cyanobacterium CRU_2_2]|nr:hypothetical protein [Synechococcales cyanobacterium CRU_2_2]